MWLRGSTEQRRRKCAFVKHTQNNQTEKCDIDGWLSKIDNVVGIFQDCESQLEIMSKKLSEIDRKISDINHYLEFGIFNAYQGWLCSKILKELFCQRRQCKDEIAILQNIVDARFTKSNVTHLRNSIAGLKTRTYAPRCLPELYETINKSQQIK